MTEETEFKEKSFLVADCGHTNTTVVLFDTVAGKYRLIARASVPTTAASPWSDIAQGVHQAIAHISDITGRPLLNEQGKLIRPTRADGSGVDHFTAVASAASPLKTVLVGLSDNVSLSSARKALRSNYVYEVDNLSLADTRDEQDQVAALIQTQPDLVFITGGTDGGAEERLLRLIETVSLGVTALAGGGQRIQVVFAGNINLREKIRELMDEIANVQMVNNVRPDLEVEQLDDTVHIVGELYEDIKINRLPGMHELSEWSSYPIVSTAHAFARISQNLAALQEQKVFGVDLGSNSVTLVSATPEQVKLAVHTDLGMGSPMLNLLEKVSPTAINHWMPSEISAAETADFVFNKALNPHTIPMTETELHLEQAVAREIIRCSVLATANDWGWFHQNQHPQVPPFGTLLARGSILANSPRPGQVILLLLDALQPTGIFSIALDQYGVLPTLGALATHEPLAVVQSLEGGVLTNLGWIIAPAGKAQQGKKALKIAIESEQVRFEGEIEYGKIELFPIAPGEAAKVTIKPTKRFDIGLGPGKGTTQTLYGGIAGGLVVDARGRPISLPRDDADRRSLVRKWLWDMGG